MSAIVVVEDEKDVLHLLCEVLESDGFQVVGLGRPDQVRCLESELHPDLFLLDLMLPGMTGIDLARRLRSCGYGVEPMIAMSASTRMLADASESGLFQEIISKPFDLTTLLDAIERHTA